ncbi:SEC-C domain-containing protein [Kutzneria sp. NPDC052558]|uniref:SEC-C domain-containing protein n=1 Tax=Kutzneria sp. NPDC052558 TaxID=3364121 RepID=UPI0037C514A8
MALSDSDWTSLGGDGTYHYSATALVVFWPESEHENLIARWPGLTSRVGTTWDEHRRRVEQECALISDDGYTVKQTPGDIPGLEAFLRDKDVKKPQASDLEGYPDLRTQPDLTPWPPARTAACWCGSGRKYKQCCRPHGLGSLD